MKEAGCSAHNIDLILLTHFHGDHVMGLPGILMSMGMSGRTEPVTIVGPENLLQVVSGLCIAAGIPFEVQTVELKKPEYRFPFPDGSLMHIHAFAVKHSVKTYGYTLELERRRRFDPEQAAKYHIPIKYWSRLQKDETIRDGGMVYTPDMVLGEQRRGIKVTYCTDTRPTELIAKAAAGSDLAIFEGMYGSDERLEAARVKHHMIFSEAAALAKEARVGELWLTHYSPSEPDPEQWIDNARSIFPNSQCGSDGKHIVLNYPDDEE